MLWLCGQTRRGKTWEFQGIFDSEARAHSACRNWHYWIAPIELNQEICDETELMPGAYYPITRLHGDK